MNIQLSIKWFNPLFWHVLAALQNNNIRSIYVYGGSSAAKTYSILQALLVDQLQRDYNTMVFRKEQTSIKDTVYNDYKEIGDQLGLKPILDFKIGKIELTTGSYVRFRGIDNAGKVKGIKGYKKLYLDELDQFDIEEFRESRRRLRGEDNQQIIGSWNPVSENHWLKEWLDKIEWIEQPKELEGNPYSRLHESSLVQISADETNLLIRTTYHDNKWIVGGKGFGRTDEHAIREFDLMKELDENDYNVYALGIWGKIRTGNEWFSKFKTAIHVKECTYDPNLPVHISFDFNVVPYMTMLVFQIYDMDNYSEVRQIKEYCIGEPDNTTEDVCLEFLYDFSDHKTGVFFYGDATGKNRTTVSKEHRHNYDVIQSVLVSMLSNNSKRVPKSNPSPNRCRQFFARLLLNLLPVRYIVDPSCEKTIKDLSELKQDANGGFLKKKVKDKKTGITYEELGHCGDALKYFMAECFKNLYENYESYQN